MGIAYFGGSSLFSRIILEAIRKDYELVAIVESSLVSNQKPGKLLLSQIRKMRSYFCPTPSLQQFGKKESIPYYLLQTADQLDLATFIKEVQPDLICSCLFGRLIKPAVFNIPKHKAINIHPSLLPKYPGPDPLFWQYYFMDLEGGLTIHYIDSGEDTGDIIKQQQIVIKPGMELKQYAKLLVQAAVPLLLEILRDIEKGTVTSNPQGSSRKFRARQVDKKEDLIDWAGWPIERIWHLVRGYEKRFELIPRPKYIPGFYWNKIGHFEKITDQICPSPRIRFDFKGFYLALKDGKIRLKPGYSFRKGLKRLLLFCRVWK